MKRKIIHIDEEKCNGCGLCAAACHEHAIGMVNGKARLLREDYCDGLGDCLPSCPAGAITFEEREAAAYDHAAVLAHKAEALRPQESPSPRGCPGSMPRRIERKTASPGKSENVESQLRQWPVQLQLAPVNAPYFDGAKLLIAADCAAYAYAGFHRDFIRGKIVLIGCPKLDEANYEEKLTEILARNDIRSVTVVRMEVPCCGGLEQAVIQALKNSGKFIAWQVITLSTDGQILD